MAKIFEFSGYFVTSMMRVSVDMSIKNCSFLTEPMFVLSVEFR